MELRRKEGLKYKICLKYYSGQLDKIVNKIRIIILECIFK